MELINHPRLVNIDLDAELNADEFESLVFDLSDQYFKSEKERKKFAKEVRQQSFNSIEAIKSPVGLPASVEDILESDPQMLLAWNPFGGLSRKVRCAICYTGYALIAAAIVAATAAAIASGLPASVIIPKLVLKFAIPETVATVAAAGGGVGVIATMLCPSCGS